MEQQSRGHSNYRPRINSRQTLFASTDSSWSFLPLITVKLKKQCLPLNKSINIAPSVKMNWRVRVGGEAGHSLASKLTRILHRNPDIPKL